MAEGERINIYLPFTVAQAVREAKAAGHPVNLSESAARGIRQSLNGSGPPQATETRENQGHEMAGLLKQLRAELGEDGAQDREQLAATVDGWFKVIVVFGLMMWSTWALTRD